jgi:hypothetical protein
MASRRDRFDRLEKERGRVGAHRGKVRHGRGWVGLAVFLVALVVVTAAALFVTDRFLRVTSADGQGLNLPFLPQPTTPPPTTPPPTPPPPVETDPAVMVARGLGVLIVNATPLDGIEAIVGDELAAGGWPILGRISAQERTAATTIVYYLDPANSDLARGLVKVLGAGEVAPMSPAAFPNQPIVIVLGKDARACAGSPDCSAPAATPDPSESTPTG